MKFHIYEKLNYWRDEKMVKDLKLDEDTHTLLKIEAAKRKTTMPGAIRQMISLIGQVPAK